VTRSFPIIPQTEELLMHKVARRENIIPAKIHIFKIIDRFKATDPKKRHAALSITHSPRESAG